MKKKRADLIIEIDEAESKKTVSLDFMARNENGQLFFMECEFEKAVKEIRTTDSNTLTLQDGIVKNIEFCINGTHYTIEELEKVLPKKDERKK